MRRTTLKAWKAWLTGLAAVAAATSAIAQPAGYRAVDPENLLVVETTKGRALVEMRPDVAPLTVARVKELARKGFYDDDAFYRVIPGYMAQTGAKTITSVTPSGLGVLTDEFRFTPSAPVPPEGGFAGSMAIASDGAGKAYGVFCPGTASMAHYAEANSADSQIFFTTGRAPVLDKAYSPWGRVVAGAYVFGIVAPGEPPATPDRTKRVRVAADIPAAERPNVYVAAPGGPAFDGAVAHAQQLLGKNYNTCGVDIPFMVKVGA